MIDCNNHFDRYDLFMSIVSRENNARRKDRGYMSALYILSSDNELFRLSYPFIGAAGIDFKAILNAARRDEISASQLLAIKAAHNLFNGGSASVRLADLSQCDYSTLDIITNAFYICKGGRDPICGESGQVHFDDTAEQRSRTVYAAFSAM